MKTYPHYSDRIVHDLNGVWDCLWLGEECDLDAVDVGTLEPDSRISVPSAFDAYPDYAGRRGTLAYLTTLEVTPGTTGILEFGGCGMWNRIYVDGAPVGEAAMPYSGVRLTVPPSESGLRRIVVISDNRLDRERVALQEQYFDFYAYGGIFRPVYWHEVGETWIERVQVRTVDTANCEVVCKAVFGPAGSAPAPDLADTGNVSCAVDGNDVSILDPSAADGVLTFRLRLEGAELWSPGNPALHLLELSTPYGKITERFGLRTVETKDTRVLINGEPTKLLGYCRHEAHPQFGPALPLQQLVQDVQLLRDQGCNFVRGAHYPQDQRFLDLCDEYGLLVFEESLGWQQNETHFADERYCSACEEQTRLMVRNSYNHPSVIMWGFLNEGKSDLEESRPLYRRLAAAISEEDGSRPVTYATNHPLTDLNVDLADIISVNNYPGWYSRDRESIRPLGEIVPALTRIREHFRSDAAHAGKPLIVSEIGAGAIYGWRDPHRAHWSEEYQAEYLDIVCREVVENDDIAGVSLWQFCGARTYSSAGALFRPRAFNNKGVLNEYRKPKLAYEVVKSWFRGR